MHQKARKIAVSANPGTVTVFSFELTTSSIPETTDYSTGVFKKQKFTMTNNVPSVTFDNTGSDPAGTWLLANDINGTVGFLNLKTGQCMRNIALGWEPEEEPFGRSLWGAIFVNKHTCHLSNSNFEAFGISPPQRFLDFWNVSKDMDVDINKYEDAFFLDECDEDPFFQDTVKSEDFICSIVDPILPWAESNVRPSVNHHYSCR